MFLDGWRSANFAVLDTNDLILIVKIFSVMVNGQSRPKHGITEADNMGFVLPWELNLVTEQKNNI